MLGSFGYFGVTFVGKMASGLMWKETTTFKNWLLKLSKIPNLSVICVAHGDVITSNCEEMMKKAANTL